MLEFHITKKEDGKKSSKQQKKVIRGTRRKKNEKCFNTKNQQQTASVLYSENFNMLATRALIYKRKVHELLIYCEQYKFSC